MISLNVEWTRLALLRLVFSLTSLKIGIAARQKCLKLLEKGCYKEYDPAIQMKVQMERCFTNNVPFYPNRLLLSNPKQLEFLVSGFLCECVTEGQCGMRNLSP